MAAADYGAEPGKWHGNGRGPESAAPSLTDGFPIAEADAGSLQGTRSAGQAAGQGANRGGRNPVARILLILYIAGVAYFSVRFLYLVTRLLVLALRNGIVRQEGFRIVEMKEEFSPFSFFHLLFINREAFNDSEFRNVLAHERAHIRQGHSIDHLFAQGLAAFQWFNPFAWQIRNALKTTHEYIADREVIENGFELFDYQSLLLRQVIGYHSVELVNNFNLKPIKKRIAMMTRKRSGIPARLKAMLVIPFALAIFLIFADFTLKGPGNDLLEPGGGPESRALRESLAGLWERYGGTPGHEGSGTPDLLYITPERFSYIEGADVVREYFWKSEPGDLILSGLRNGPGTSLKFAFEGADLKLWWTDSKSLTYRKTGSDNTLDLALSRMPVKIRPPSISQYRIMVEKRLTCRVSLGYGNDGEIELLFNAQPLEIGDLADRMEEFRSKVNKLDRPLITVILWVDRDIPMKEVIRVKEELRRIKALKTADGGYPYGTDHSVSPLLYSSVALPRLLPPPDAKILDKSELEKQGIRIFTIDLSARNSTPADVESSLERFIKDNEGGKYIFSLEYDGDIPYSQYIESVDMVFNVVYRFRKAMSMEKYGLPYDMLGEDVQKEIRNAYPMVLSEAWNEI